mgnify:FL=1
MTTGKKIIKYLSMAFAIFLTFTIISGITNGLYSLISVFRNTPSNEEVKELWQNINTNIDDIDIDLIYNNLNIKVGNKFSVETNSKNVKYTIQDSTLIVKENKKVWNSSNTKKDELTIYIPSNIVLNKIDIDMGAGTLNIENINTRKLTLDLGAGSTLIKNIYSDNTNINTGAGSFTIENGNINDLDLDIGVGKTTITSKITGNSTIDTGIGSLSLNLIGNNYTFKVNKGIGKVVIDNKEARDNEVLGTGSNTIKLNGGIGDTTVTLNKDR